MPNISEIAQGANYLGSPQLGGYSNTAIDLDVKPIQQLAQYTFLTNKSNYDQHQKDVDEKIAKLAELAPYDLVNGEGKDSAYVLDALKKMRERGARFAATNWKTPDEKDKAYFAFQKDIADYKNLITSANKRAIAYDLEKSRINLSDVPEGSKKIQLQDLDKQFKSTDIFTPIVSTAKVEVPEISVGTPVLKNVTQVVKDTNGFTEVKSNFFDVAKNTANADVISLGLFQPPLPENATEDQKRQYQISAFGNDKNKFWQKMGEVYNSAFTDPKYSKIITDPVTGEQKAINEVDLNKIKENPLLQGQQELLNRYNTWATQQRQNVIDGKYKDYIDPKTNLVTTVSADEFRIIDPTKPLQPRDLAFLELFRQAAPDKTDKDYKYTGDATKVRLENIQQAGENWRLLHKPTTEKAPSAIVDEAKVFTETLLGKIAAATNPDGTVDLAKAQLTPLELQMMGNGEVTKGQFSLSDPLSPTAKLIYDKNTNTVVAETPIFKLDRDGNRVENGSNKVNINFQQIANNKYNSNSVSETGAGENKNRQQLISDYGASGKPEPPTASKNVRLVDYPIDTQRGIKAFMKKYSLPEQKAIEILKSKNKIQ